MAAAERRRVITLLTDFGLADAYVGVMKGVILGIAPHATVVDLCHDVPAHDVRSGAFLLLTSYSYLPPGTIHVAVVDPGVGTGRRLLVARAGEYTFIGPDNGLLRWALDRAASAIGERPLVVSLENTRYRLPQVSRTFHGRDVFGPAAAHLANGVPLTTLGPVIDQIAGEPFPLPRRAGTAWHGCVVYVDRFGNCVTNLPGTLLEGTDDEGRTTKGGRRRTKDERRRTNGTGPSSDTQAQGRRAPVVEVAGRWVPVRNAYGEAAAGEALAVVGSTGYVEVAVREGSAARGLGIGAGTPAALRTQPAGTEDATPEER